MTRQAERLRKAWEYEEHAPRCSNCKGFQKAKLAHDPDQGHVIAVPHTCSKGKFTVKPHGCCDKWQSSRGERLA
jgi:hypothetical protein